MGNNKGKPARLTVFKVLGFAGFCVGLALMARHHDFPSLAAGGFLAVVSLTLLLSGFFPDKFKLSAKGKNNGAQKNGAQELADIANTAAGMANSAVKKAVRVIKTGLKKTKPCRRCGKEIESDSLFCKDCGIRQ